MNIDKIKIENDFVRARANDRWNSMTIMSYLDEYDEICKNEKGNVTVYIFYLPANNWVVVQFEDGNISAPSVIIG